MLLDPETFRKRLRGFERDAWRWECQQVYNFPAELEQVARYMAGESKPDGYNDQWLGNVRGIVDSGRSIGRVRAVRRPLTDYVRCQLDWVIPDSVQAGEDIRILEVAEDDPDAPSEDFWLFDGALVVRLNFSEDGSLLNIEELEESDVRRYVKWMGAALTRAVPFDEYARTERQ